MASDVSGVTSKEIELKRLQAELALEEQVTRLAQKRLAVRVLEAEIHSTSNRSVRSYASMTSPVIQSPPLKIHKSKGGDGPPEGDPNGDDEGPEDDSCPTTEYKPSPSPSPSAPIVEEASTTTSRIELPIDNNDPRRIQLFPPKAEEFNIATPVVCELSNERIAQQEFLLQAEADAERIRLASQELRLKTIAKGVQNESEINALNMAMAEHRLQEGEMWVNEEHRAAENRVQSSEAKLKNEANQALKTLRAEENTQRLRAMELEQQLENYYYTEQGIRDESVARSVQQRVIEIEQQSRKATEDLVGLSELKQREKVLKEENAYKEHLRIMFEEEQRRLRNLAESTINDRENKMQIAFDEKYQSQFNIMQAEVNNQLAAVQNDREQLQRDRVNHANAKDKEIEILRLQLLEARKALDKASRPGSSRGVPAEPFIVSATVTNTKVVTETIKEENNRQPPKRPGGYGGDGGGGSGDPGGPSGSGSARQPADNYNKQNPGNPGGPNDPNPPDDHWEANSSSQESARIPVGIIKHSKEAEKITLPSLPKADMFRHWKLTVPKTILSASIDPNATWEWLLEIENPHTTFESLYDPGDYFRTLDTKLCVSVDMLVRDNHSLKSDIDIETETLAKQGKRIAGRQVLQMV